jgi:mRNA interferase MazF
MNTTKIRRGDIFYAELNPVVGSEQNGKRPVVIVQNDIGNIHSPTTIITPLTHIVQKKPLPTHVFIQKACGLDRDSLLLTEQIRTIDRLRLENYIGHISENDDIMPDINNALSVCVGLDKQRPQKNNMLELNLCPYCISNFENNGHLFIQKGFQEDKFDCDLCEDGKGLPFVIFKSKRKRRDDF